MTDTKNIKKNSSWDTSKKKRTTKQKTNNETLEYESTNCKKLHMLESNLGRALMFLGTKQSQCPGFTSFSTTFADLGIKNSEWVRQLSSLSAFFLGNACLRWVTFIHCLLLILIY